MKTWEKVKNFENYEVSRDGQVRSVATKHELKTFDNRMGYMIVILSKDGKPYHKRVHRLVAEAFIKNPDNLPVVNHKDENKANNNYKNLEWTTHSKNINYSLGNRRKNNKRTKVKCIETREIFSSVHAAAKALKVSTTAIFYCLDGKTKTCAGYHLKRVE